jgi:hypothetical protein
MLAQGFEEPSCLGIEVIGLFGARRAWAWATSLSDPWRAARRRRKEELRDDVAAHHASSIVGEQDHRALAWAEGHPSCGHTAPEKPGDPLGVVARQGSESAHALEPEALQPRVELPAQ